MARGQLALERVLRIRPQGYNQSHRVAKSSIALVKEYLRRVAEWVELSNPPLARLPFGPRDVLIVDLAELLLPELTLAPEIIARVAEAQCLGISRIVFANFVRWEAAAEHRLLAESGLWEPYEPLIRLYERGGELFTHHGSIHVEHSESFYPRDLQHYATLPPFLDLRDWALDKLDRSQNGMAPDGDDIK